MQFDLAFSNLIHFADAVANGDCQKDHFKSHPPRMFDRPPWAGIKHAIDGLRPVKPAEHVIEVNYNRTGHQTPPIAIEGEDCQGTEDVEMRLDAAARDVD